MPAEEENLLQMVKEAIIALREQCLGQTALVAISLASIGINKFSEHWQQLFWGALVGILLLCCCAKSFGR